jgi:hypothetical protein
VMSRHGGVLFLDEVFASSPRRSTPSVHAHPRVMASDVAARRGVPQPIDGCPPAMYGHRVVAN